MRASTSLFQYEDEICDEPGGLKKKRLSAEQVGELERCFETENKLEPDRKTKLADQLGLHPRQVAIWFQNKRARWKTKQLEREYGVLRANYNDLKLNFESLLQEKDKLCIEVDQLKRKLKKSEEHNGEDNHREGSDSEASVLDLDNMPIRSFLHSSDQDNTNCYKVNCFPFGNPDSSGSGDCGSGNVRAPENWMGDQHHFIKTEDHDHGGGFLGGEGGSTTMNFSMGEHNTHSWAWSDHWA